MKSLSACRLYAFVDTAYLHGRKPDTVAQQLCEGGADLIQLRAKALRVAEVKKLVEAVLPITRQAGVGLVLNDHWALARELGVEFCHLGQEDFAQTGLKNVRELSTVGPGPAASRASFGASDLSVGLSTHSPEQARAALAAGADYLGVGPVYATGTKPSAKPVTLEYVRWAAANVRIPWFAIGGITLDNINEVLAAGASRVCVVSAILNSADVTAACRAFAQRLAA